MQRMTALNSPAVRLARETIHLLRLNETAGVQTRGQLLLQKIYDLCALNSNDVTSIFDLNSSEPTKYVNKSMYVSVNKQPA